MKKIKTAIIGCGYWGPNFIRNISRNCRCELVAVCDILENKLKTIKEIYPYIERINDYKDLLTHSNIDAVIVSTPVNTHYKIVRDFLQNDKHILCEKPITILPEEALELNKISKERNLILMVGHIFEYNSAIQYIKKTVLKEDFGKILYVYFTRTGLGPVREEVNAMWDLASHDISIILYLLDKMPVAVTAFGEIYLQKNIHDVVFLILEFEEKIIVKIHVSWLNPFKTRNMTIVGENKMIVFDDVSNFEKVRIYDKGVGYQTTNGEFGEFQLAIRDGNITIPNVKYKEPLKTELNHFIDCIIENKQPLTDAISGYNVVKVLEAGQKSLESGNIKVKL